jgi:type III secretion protein K
MSGLSLFERSMVVFNFLPSKTLHPSRIPDYRSQPYIDALAAAPGSAAVWHRHWSQAILKQEGLLDRPVTDTTATGLAVAVLQHDALVRLVRRMGVVVCAPRLRYAISADAVRALQAALGQDVLRWIKDGRAMHPGLAGEMFRDADDAVQQVDLAGRAALRIAFQSARPELARRFFLKLPTARGFQGDVACATDRDTDDAGGTGGTGGTGDAGDTGGTVAGGIERELSAAIDSHTAMGLAMALQTDSIYQGQG